MRRETLAMFTGAGLGLATPAAAQDQPAPASSLDSVQFDLGARTQAAEAESDAEIDPVADSWGLGEYFARQQETERASCGSDSDLLAAQSTERPRYDDNGALIRQAPSAACVPPGSRYGRLGMAVRAEEERRAATQTASGSDFLRQPDCTESSNGYSCSASGTSGGTTYRRSQQCQETPTGRTCSSSFSAGSSTEGASAAQEALDRLLQD